MPYFSVIIPLYNKQNYIAATLESVLAQTFTDFEIIVINDVSTDNSLSVAQKFNDSRIKIINHPVNKGLSASRNTGIKNAESPFVAFLDADDIWKPLFLEKIYELTLNFPNADLFSTKYEEIYPGDVIIEHPFKIENGIIENFFKLNLTQPIYCPSSLCVRKNAFEKTGFYNEKITLGEDVDFNIRAHIVCKMAYFNQPLVRYTMLSENQITRATLKNKIITDYDFYEKTNPDHKDLKKYLDFSRYTMAKRYKLDGDQVKYKKLVKAIAPKSLNYKQLILLHSPTFVLKAIRKIKLILIKKGINPTTY